MLPRMQKKFPALCHSLLNLGPAGQPEGIPPVPVTMLAIPVVNVLEPPPCNQGFGGIKTWSVLS